MAKTIKGRVAKAGGWTVAKRIIKPIPIVGTVFAFGMAAFEIRRKGLIPGAVHVGLDVIPVVGTAKNVVEIFTGDWIPDKKQKEPDYVPPRALPEPLDPDQS